MTKKQRETARALRINGPVPVQNTGKVASASFALADRKPVGNVALRRGWDVDATGETPRKGDGSLPPAARMPGLSLDPKAVTLVSLDAPTALRNHDNDAARLHRGANGPIQATRWDNTGAHGNTGSGRA